MPHFEYNGRDSAGALVSGSLDAGSVDEVATRLFGDNITPIDINETGQSESGQPRRAKSAVKRSKSQERLNLFLTRSKVDIEELIIFARQMHSLTKAGLPLDRAIKGLEASLTNKYFRNVLRSIIIGLEQGQSLASSLGRNPRVFSQLFLSMVHVGENTGRLDLAFLQISKYLELERNTRRQVKSATRYPMFVLVAIAVALGIITTVVIPVFAETFANFGADLPWQTVVLMRSSEFVVDNWPYILITIIAAITTFVFWVNTPLGRLSWDRRKIKLPLAGPVLEKVALARFARTLSMVMAAGVPIVQGLTVVAGAVGNAFVSKRVMKMREGVERGESLHRTAVKARMFSPLVLQMIAVGEETGAVDDLLHEVADFYDTEVEYELKRLGDAIEPILIVFIAGLVLILALGVFLPLWDLNTAINN
ncbi:MAG: type II secretion system F family protein [Gammaproteobacteria bacterium]